MDEIVRLEFLRPKITDYVRTNGQTDPSSFQGSALQRSLQLWRELQRQTSDPLRLQEFELTLGSVRRKSWRVLSEWWNGRYHPPLCKRDDESILQLLRKGEKVYENRSFESLPTPSYELTLAYLFVVEMIWYQRLQALDGLPLRQLPPRANEILTEVSDKAAIARANALECAVWQMIGFSSYQEIRPSKPGAPNGTLFMGTTVEACPWLNLEDRASLRKPFYLWDRLKKETLETSRLQEPLSYYCISHTWGRWRKDPVRVPGVKWLVPRNSRFDILSLPETFSQLDWPVRYVWFDLFCIPQEDCAQQAEEIGKQAEIFRQAERTVVWCNDILGWKMLENAVLWLGLNIFRRMNPGDPELRACHDTFTHHLNESWAKLIANEGDPNPWCRLPEVEPTGEQDKEAYQNDPGPKWFSSLWALQEAYLSPYALLADRDWNYFKLGDRIMLTLDNLTSLAYSPASRVNEADGAIPTMVEIFQFTMRRWELTDLSRPSQGTILLAAESRLTTGSRAEAIMSALGFTSWYEDYTKEHGRAPPSKDLVLNAYPLEFLHEAQRKMGGAFWLYGRDPPPSIRDVELEKPLGTLLPVAFNKQSWRVAAAGRHLLTNWWGSFTGGWEIQPDGTVAVTRAAILVRDGQKLPKGRDGPIAVTMGDSYKEFQSFNDWVGSLPRVPHRFIVAVARYTNRFSGVVLEGKPSSMKGEKFLLVKTRSIQIMERRFPEDMVDISSVNWVVL
ncbi:hypothetical protein F4779DRAFT_594904 [Xylariaceae sp. FL0662B]|nr:hypothetical protein F4779DRAFT_594904 [Xylariaceae sp. FL0662B]